MQNRHRHSNIFSLACVLIRMLINVCNDAPHLSRVPSYPPLLSLSRVLYLSFTPSRVRFTCLHQAIRIHIYIVTVSVIHIVVAKLSVPSFGRGASFRCAYLHLLFYNRSPRDGTVINSLLPCRFFATIQYIR